MLDEHFTAKISDFGFSIYLPQIQQNKTMVTALLIARTEGYFPPELTSGKFSDKSDVFSYGVVRLKFMWYVYNYNLLYLTLETYTGLVAYKECCSDPKLVCISFGQFLVPCRQS